VIIFYSESIGFYRFHRTTATFSFRFEGREIMENILILILNMEVPNGTDRYTEVPEDSHRLYHY
jgi:hypothetical protein